MIPGSFTHANRVRYTLGVNINKGTIINLHCVQRKIEEFYIYKEGFFYFSIYTVSRIFFDAVSKLIERVSSLRTSYRVVSLYLSSMHIHELLELPDSKLSVFTFYLHILSRLRSTSILKFTSRLVLRLPLHCGTGLLFMQLFPRIICALEKYGDEPLVAFTYFHVRFRIFTKRSLCLRLFVNLK